MVAAKSKGVNRVSCGGVETTRGRFWSFVWTRKGVRPPKRLTVCQPPCPFGSGYCRLGGTGMPNFRGDALNVHFLKSAPIHLSGGPVCILFVKEPPKLVVFLEKKGYPEKKDTWEPQALFQPASCHLLLRLLRGGPEAARRAPQHRRGLVYQGLSPPLLYHLVAPSFLTFAVAPLLYPSALLPLFLYLLSAFKFGEELDKPFGARRR